MTTRAECIAEFKRMYGECQYTDWDGEGAYPIKYKSLLHCIAFIEALPDGIMLPEPAPEPTGQMCMCWYFKSHSVALSINTYGDCTWAMCKRDLRTVSGTFNWEGIVEYTLLQYLKEL